jgi:restriction system protein
MGVHVGSKPLEENYIAIGWVNVGDLSKVPADREAFKRLLNESHESAKPGAIRNWAGTLYRFRHEIKKGDYVIYPSKSDRMINIGRIAGNYQYCENDSSGYPNQYSVEWLGHFPRDQFSQAALYEVGSALTLFSVKNYANEFLAAIDQEQKPTNTEEELSDDDSITSEASNKAVESASDFIIRRLKNNLSPYEFEKFIAHLLECMGYHARVTQQSADGGVDVIAHRDELGFEPPIIKVQCKQITSNSGDPDVNQLLGTLGDGEYGLFVNLGSFSSPARATERNKSKLRLIDGEQLVELIQENYHKLAHHYRTIIPLKQVYVADI